MHAIDPMRVMQANDQPVNQHGEYVLYWMTAFRRTRWNFSLQHAVNLAMQLQKPLVILEPLRVNYRWASDRFHRFIIEGMQSNRQQFSEHCVTYLPYVEPTPGASQGLLEQMGNQACTVVTDDYPCFFLPTLIRQVKKRLKTRLELVDSNGLIPIRLADKTFTVAHSYRRWMQKNIEEHLQRAPLPNPLQDVCLPKLDSKSLIDRLQAWPLADLDHLLEPNGLHSLPIDHSVSALTKMEGGETEGSRRLEVFVRDRLALYDTDRNHPDFEATSRLSPYLHFGHVSAHQFVQRIFEHENWNPSRLGVPNGKNHSFWNLSVSAEGLMDQLVTWRELGFNFAARHPREMDRYQSLPNWAKASLETHARDPRPYLYSLEDFENAQTHDEVWNAAQRELVQTGTLHNYMRMLWGKQILHWSSSPKHALRILIHLNNKYALDGRDPNSYSGIFWVLGRYDRAWGPKRPVFGSVRYMTSESAMRKLKMKKYLQRYAENPTPLD